MTFTEDPEFLEHKPLPEEIEAVKFLASQRNEGADVTVNEAIELLAEVRLRQAQIEREALSKLRERTHSTPYRHPKVERVYRTLITIAVVALFAYIVMRMNGGR